MFRKLTAIEIAEGALLANIAVIFQLLILYLPVGRGVFRFFIPIVFTVLVLRRGLYTGIMSFCVGLFIAGVLSGPGFLSSMFLEGGAGLFLGLTMKYRLSSFLLIPLGVTGGAILIFGLLLLSLLLSGLPLSDSVEWLHKNYLNVLSLVDFMASNIGLGYWWKHNVYPLAAQIGTLIVPYGWEFLLLAIWIVLWPMVIVVYYITNVFVRLLGYEVRSFPGGGIDKLMRKIARMLLKQGLRRGLIRRPNGTRSRMRRRRAAV